MLWKPAASVESVLSGAPFKVIAVAAMAACILAVAGTWGCQGGEITVPPLCDAAAPPSGLAAAPIYAHVAFDDAGAHVVAEGGTAVVLPGGRLLSPAAPTFGNLGFPVNVVTHPRLPFAYVVDMDVAAFDGTPSARCFTRLDAGDGDNSSGIDPGDGGNRVRGIHVMDLRRHREIQGPEGTSLPVAPSQAIFGNQDILCSYGASWAAPHDASYGIAITKTATPARLYVSTGLSGFVYEFQVVEEPADGGPPVGSLLPLHAFYVGGYTAGIALSADETRLWVVQFVSSTSQSGSSVVEVLLDPAATATARRFDLPIQGGYAIAALPGDGMDKRPPDSGEILYVTGFRSGDLYKVTTNLPQDAAVTDIPVGTNPEGIVTSSDGTYVFVSVSDDDRIVAVQASDGGIAKVVSVIDDLADQAGAVRGSSPSALAIDPAKQRLYVARSSDNAVSVFSSAPGPDLLRPLGAIPVGFYPTGLAMSDAGLVVVNAKGLAYNWNYAAGDSRRGRLRRSSASREHAGRSNRRPRRGRSGRSAKPDSPRERGPVHLQRQFPRSSRGGHHLAHLAYRADRAREQDL